MTPTPFGGPARGLALTGTQTGYAAFGGALFAFDGGALTPVTTISRVSRWVMNDGGVVWQDWDGRLFRGMAPAQQIPDTGYAEELRGGTGTHWVIGRDLSVERVGKLAPGALTVAPYSASPEFAAGYAFRGATEAYALLGTGGFGDGCTLVKSTGGAWSTVASYALPSQAFFMDCALSGGGSDIYVRAAWFGLANGVAAQRLTAAGSMVNDTRPGLMIMSADGRALVFDGGTLLVSTGAGYAVRASGLPSMDPTFAEERPGAYAVAGPSQLWLALGSAATPTQSLQSPFAAAERGGSPVPGVVAGAALVVTRTGVWRYLDGGVGGYTAHAGFAPGNVVDWQGRPWAVGTTAMGFVDTAAAPASPALGGTTASFGDVLATPTSVLVAARVSLSGAPSGSVIARSDNGTTFTKVIGPFVFPDGGASPTAFDGGVGLMGSNFFNGSTLAGASANDFYASAVSNRLLHWVTDHFVEHVVPSPITDLCVAPTGDLWAATGDGISRWTGSALALVFASSEITRLRCTATRAVGYSVGSPKVAIWRGGSTFTWTEAPIIPRRCAQLPSGEVLCAGQDDDVVVWRP